jgi:hypothetical protein
MRRRRPLPGAPRHTADLTRPHKRSPIISGRFRPSFRQWPARATSASSPISCKWHMRKPARSRENSSTATAAIHDDRVAAGNTAAQFENLEFPAATLRMRRLQRRPDQRKSCTRSPPIRVMRPSSSSSRRVARTALAGRPQPRTMSSSAVGEAPSTSRTRSMKRFF